MSSITLTNSTAIRTAVAGARIPRRSWADMNNLTQVLREADKVLQSAQQEAEAAREAAANEGYMVGLARAHASTVRHLMESQRAAREFLDASEERIVALAVAIVERIAPELGEAELVSALVTEALSALRAERQVRVYVSEQALDAVRAMLEQWQRSRPDIETVQVAASSQLEPFACVIESELGRIEAGLRTQLAALGEGLRAIAAERKP